MKRGRRNPTVAELELVEQRATYWQQQYEYLQDAVRRLLTAEADVARAREDLGLITAPTQEE